MLKKDAIQQVGSQAEIARALGISTAAVAKWGEVVPIESALAIEVHTSGAVKVDRSMYPILARAVDAAEQRAAHEAA